MEKRLFIAVGISLLFLWLYSLLLPKFFPELAKKPAVSQASTDTRPEGGKPRDAVPPRPGTPSAAQPQPSVAPAAVVAVERGASAIRTVVETADFRAIFSNEGAQLVSYELKGYLENDGKRVELVRRRPDSGYYPFFVESTDKAFSQFVNLSLYAVDARIENGRGHIEYRLSDGAGRAVRKRYEFGERFRFSFNIETKGFDGRYRVMVGPGIHEIDKLDESNKLLVTGNGLFVKDNDLKTLNREKAGPLTLYDGVPQYVGLEDNYFLAALQPGRGGSAVFRRLEIPAENAKARPRHELYAGLNADGGVVAGHAFLGPKEASILELYGLDKALHLGFFGPIARGLLYALLWVNKYTANYGWAIVVLTVVIKILLYPLQHKSMVSMRKMQQVQPKVNALREKFKKAKSDPAQKQKLNEEMMKLYQVEGINPMSGCFPILLQLPILWAFYSLLSSAIELRGAAWILWIHDLAAKDPYYLTPILMTITMVAQQKLMPSTADPVQAKMMMFMPFIFGFIFKDFPSGLVLYWLVQNVLSIIQQLIMNRYWKGHPIPVNK